MENLLTKSLFSNKIDMALFLSGILGDDKTGNRRIKR
jgi:hypothetical protein